VTAEEFDGILPAQDRPDRPGYEFGRDSGSRSRTPVKPFLVSRDLHGILGGRMQGNGILTRGTILIVVAHHAERLEGSIADGTSFEFEPENFLHLLVLILLF
jgi:hypothetical protein